MSLNPAQNRKFHATWRDAVRKFQEANLDKTEIEEERQSVIKLAGVKADKEGRFSTTRMTPAQLSTALDLIETTILGRPNKKRRSRQLIYAIAKLGIGDAYLNQISRDQFKTDDWKTLPVENLVKLRYTATSRARSKSNPTH